MRTELLSTLEPLAEEVKANVEENKNAEVQIPAYMQ
jgi:hypothetical protein